LDDGFQHRRLRRDVDVVLLSADAPPVWPRMLPAGPMREPFSALRRCSLAIVTRKVADDSRVDCTVELIRRHNAELPIAVASLRAQQLVSPQGNAEPLSMLQGQRLLAVTSIADPASFERELRGLGAVVTGVRYRDHHVFSSGDVGELVRRSAGAEMVICTLKDAVKLQSLWPRSNIPLWYVSQAVEIEHGGDILDLMLDSRIVPKP
jgi:tetraacyldisaccharide 4'-kinase